MTNEEFKYLRNHRTRESTTPTLRAIGQIHKDKGNIMLDFINYLTTKTKDYAKDTKDQMKLIRTIQEENYNQELREHNAKLIRHNKEMAKYDRIIANLSKTDS